MRTPIEGIDHVVVAVRDLDRARDTWRALGFTLSPRGFHTLGSQNHCLMFGRDYVELLAVPTPHPVWQHFTDFLARGEGLAAIAWATEDAAAAQADLLAAGVAAEAPLDFARPVDVGGEKRDARFRIVQLPASLTPGCRTFLCQHFTRELVWRPEWQSHPNGATGIQGVVVLADRPEQAAGSYARLIGTGAARERLSFSTRDALAAHLPGVGLPGRPAPLLAALVIGVQDRPRARALLATSGFEPVALPDGSCAVHPERANGVALVFR